MKTVLRGKTRREPLTSADTGSTFKSDGRFGKQDFVYLSTEDVIRVVWAMSAICPVSGQFRKCWFVVDGVTLAVIQARKLEPRIMRYELSDRRVLNGIFWVLRSGTPWRDLPESYGLHTTCYNRFVR